MITRQDTPEALCVEDTPEQRRKRRDFYHQDTKKHQEDKERLGVSVFLGDLVVSPLPRLCRTQGCERGEIEISSTGRDSHDRLGGRVPLVSSVFICVHLWFLLFRRFTASPADAGRGGWRIGSARR